MKTWAVYRHYDDHGRILYVGVTNDLPQRTRKHLRAAPWRERITSINATLFTSEQEALHWEREEIELWKPEYNHGSWNSKTAKQTVEEEARYLARTRERIRYLRAARPDVYEKEQPGAAPLDPETTKNPK